MRVEKRGMSVEKNRWMQRRMEPELQAWAWENRRHWAEADQRLIWRSKACKNTPTYTETHTDVFRHVCVCLLVIPLWSQTALCTSCEIKSCKCLALAFMQLRIVGLSWFLYNQGHIIYTHTHTHTLESSKCNVNMYALFLNVYTELQTVNCVRFNVPKINCEIQFYSLDFWPQALSLCGSEKGRVRKGGKGSVTDLFFIFNKNKSKSCSKQNKPV